MAIALLFAASDLTDAAEFRRLGELNSGAFYSGALNVSPDGKYVVGSAVLGQGDWEAFLWSEATGVIGLGDLPEGIVHSKAQSVSNGGKVVVGLGSNHGDNAFLDGFRWTKETGPQPVGYFDTSPMYPYNYAVGVSADGQIIVGVANSPQGNQAYRWTAEEGMQSLGDLPGGEYGSYAWDISGDGRVIVGMSESASGKEPFRWTAETGMQGLGFLPGSFSESHALAVSADGSTIVGQSGVGGWRWTSATGMVNLGTLPNPGRNPLVVALGVSADGRTIVGDFRNNGAGKEAAFIWGEAEGMRNLQDVLAATYHLDLPGWTLTDATAISDDGTVIVGSGINPLGKTEAWMVNLAVPESSGSALGVTASLASATWRRRRSRPRRRRAVL